jgi:hypothetical protein
MKQNTAALLIALLLTSCIPLNLDFQISTPSKPCFVRTNSVIHLSYYPDEYTGRAEYGYVSESSVIFLKKHGFKIISVPRGTVLTVVSQRNEPTAAGTSVIRFYSLTLPSGQLIRFYHNEQIGDRKYETPWS